MYAPVRPTPALYQGNNRDNQQFLLLKNMKGRGEGKQSTLFLNMETRTDQTRQGDLHFE